MKSWLGLLLITICFDFSFAQTTTNPQVVLQTGHIDNIYSAVFSADGKFGFTASKDRNIKMWDIKTGREMYTFQGHSEPVKVLAVSPDGNFMVSGSEDKTIIIWDLSTRKILHQLKGHTTRIDALTISPDNKLIASSSTGGDQTVRIWSSENGEQVSIINIPTVGNDALVFTTDSKRLITAGADKYIRVWDIQAMEMLKSFRKEPEGVKNGDRVSSISISPDGKSLVAAYKRSKQSGPTVIVWDLESEQEIKALNDKEFSAFSVSYSNDGNYIAAGSGSNDKAHNFVRVWDANTFKLLFTSETQRTSVLSVSFSPDNNYLLSSGFIQVRLFSVKSGQEIFNLDGLVKSQQGFFTPDNKYMVSYGSNTLRVWDLTLGKVVRYHALDSSVFNAAAISPNGRSIWTAISNNNIMANEKSINYVGNFSFDDLSLQFQKHFTDRQNMAKGISVSSDNQKVVFARKNLVSVLHTQNGTTLFESYLGLSWASGMQFLPDNNRFIVSGLGSYAKPAYMPFIDLSKANAISSSPNTSLSQLYVSSSSDGKWIASASYAFQFNPNFSLINIWTLSDSLRIAKELKGHSNFVNSLDFSSDNTKLLSTSKDKMIKIWDTSTWKETATLTGHQASVNSAFFSSDNKRIISGSEDGTLRLWDAQTNKEIAQFIGFVQSDLWLTLTPEGYYYGSKGAFDKVHYLQNGKVFSFDQFDLQYNRPDIVLQKLGTASPNMILTYKKAWEKRIRKMGFDPVNFEKQLSFNVPEITLENVPVTLIETEEKQFSISLAAKDKLYTLDRLFVDVNGVPLFGTRGKDLKAAKSKSTKQTISVPLESGSNTIKLSVLNEKGVESLAERIEVIYTPKEPIKPNLHVIAIGVSKFVESDFNLTYADKDANDVSNLMKSASGLYGNITVHTLTNENATKANVLKLRSELEQTNVDDEVIVFVASHGVLDEELDYYLAMHDMDFANPQKGGLRYDELENLIDAIPARNKLMLIDACHSGEVDKEESQLIASNDTQTNGVKSRGFIKKVTKIEGIGLANSFELMKELFADLRRNNGAVVISSASGKEFAFESSEWHNGVFTYSVLEGIQSGNADANKDKTISVSELRDYVSKRVVELTNGKQNPTSRTENLESDFRVW